MYFFTELALPLLSLTGIVFGLSFGLHKNLAFSIFTFFFILSDVINPILFFNNEKMYRESPWGYVKNYDFSFSELLHSYADSEFIFVAISFCMLIAFVVCKSLPSGSSNNSLSVPSFEMPPWRDKIIGSSLIVLAALNFLMYNYRLGITGVAGEAPFHLSGLTHYVRSYFLPVVFVLVLGKYTPGKFTVVATLLYAFLAGIASASRFVAVIPVLILMYNFGRGKKYGLILFSIVYCVLLWLIISTSRILTFSKERYDMLHVLFYSLTENSGESIVGFFDLVTGRLSGAQQVVLAYQLKGGGDCSHIVTFLLGGSVCANTAANVFGLDLSGTAYGIGLSVIPSIMISSASRWDYILPSVLISIFLLLTSAVYKFIGRVSRFSLLSFLYVIFSCIFLFAGPLLFFYRLNMVALVVLGGLAYWQKKRCRSSGMGSTI
jgi:hypothetical protein